MNCKYRYKNSESSKVKGRVGKIFRNFHKQRANFSNIENTFYESIKSTFNSLIEKWEEDKTGRS